jgi:hypothetical protein
MAKKTTITMDAGSLVRVDKETHAAIGELMKLMQRADSKLLGREVSSYTRGQAVQRAVIMAEAVLQDELNK